MTTRTKVEAMDSAMSTQTITTSDRPVGLVGDSPVEIEKPPGNAAVEEFSSDVDMISPCLVTKTAAT